MREDNRFNSEGNPCVAQRSRASKDTCDNHPLAAGTTHKDEAFVLVEDEAFVFVEDEAIVFVEDEAILVVEDETIVSCFPVFHEFRQTSWGIFVL